MLFSGGPGPIQHVRVYAEASASLCRCKGCIHEHKSSCWCLRARLRRQMFSSSVLHALWQLCLFSTNVVCETHCKITFAAQVRTPHLPKDLAARKAYIFKIESACTRSTRRLYNKQKEAKRSGLLYLANSSESCFDQTMPMREAYARGDSSASAQKPTRACAPN